MAISTRQVRIAVAASLLSASFGIATAADVFSPLERCVPADAMAVYFGRPSPDMIEGEGGGTAGSLASWLVTLKGVGLIPRDGRVAADIIGTVPILWRRPHALMLLDVSSREVRSGVYRLAQLRAALVVANRGIELDVERRIRDLLSTYADSENGKIDTRQIEGITVNCLTDARLPAWTVVEWGQVGEYFVATVGEGAFLRMIAVLNSRVPSLADDEWFKNAHARVMGSQSGVEIYCDVVRTRERLEETTKDRPAAVLEALHVRNAEKVVWTIGYDERAVRSLILGHMADGEDYFFTLAGRENASPEVAVVIPREASSYLVLRLPMGQAVRDIREAYLESQSPGQRDAVHELWMNLQKQYGFDSETDVLDQLGDHFIVHTYPPHPLRLPMLCTIWIQVAGDARRVSRAVDGMMQAWQDALNREEPPLPMPMTRKAMAAASAAADTRPAATSQTAMRLGDIQSAVARRPRFTLAPRVRHASDGLWICQLGFINPALAVTDGWIIISWSADAVRENLKYLGKSPATAPGK
jgi:hypothetical protein